ncbi:MAG: hypothetical protein IT289_04725, partial [Oligoflexia bacterium]|nr:hypothetical protein [Oligoflexia bacterium]
MASARNLIVLGLFLITFLLNQSDGLAARKEKPKSQVPAWAYDAGPSVNEPMGRELIDIYSEIPPMPGVSSEVLGKQKFRPQFGPVGWRMLLPPNSVKILFIGQDATHIA